MKYLANSLPQVLVLWGEQFDGEMAVMFLTQLRQAKVRVKLVGLRGKSTAGLYGISLLPEMTLSQALPIAKFVSSIVIPCHSPHLVSMGNDPRIRDFFNEADNNQVQFVVGRVREEEVKQFMTPAHVISCLAETEVAEAVQLVIDQLSENTSRKG